MEESALAARLRRLPRANVQGRTVPMARGPRARLLGLSHLDRERAGAGLLIPGCSSVHTFGMRFPLDLVFLDRNRIVIAVHRAVGRRRVVFCRGADSVLELPSSAYAPNPYQAPRALRRESCPQGR